MKDVYQALRWMSTMLFSCLISLWLGSLLDDFFHTSPIFLLMLLAYAITFGLYLLIRKAGKDHE